MNGISRQMSGLTVFVKRLPKFVSIGQQDEKEKRKNRPIETKADTSARTKTKPGKRRILALF